MFPVVIIQDVQYKRTLGKNNGDRRPTLAKQVYEISGLRLSLGLIRIILLASQATPVLVSNNAACISPDTRSHVTASQPGLKQGIDRIPGTTGIPHEDDRQPPGTGPPHRQKSTNDNASTTIAHVNLQFAVLFCGSSGIYFQKKSVLGNEVLDTYRAPRMANVCVKSVWSVGSQDSKIGTAMDDKVQ